MNEENNDDGFVKNIEEESNEDEYENKATEKMASSKKLKDKESKQNRPESSKVPKNQLGVPLSSSMNQKDLSDYQNSHPNEEGEKFKSYLDSDSEYKISPSKDEGEFKRANPILEKFSNYVKIHCINIENFWKSDKISMTIPEFQRSLNLINFTVKEQELNEMLQELINKNQEVTIQEICNKVDAWKHNENFMFEFIKEQALKKAQESKRKIGGGPMGKSGLRPFSSTPYYSGTNRPVSGISSGSKPAGLSEIKMPNIEKKPMRNNSAYYLKKAKEKEQEVDRLLQLTISRGKNEYEYECLIKMGDINEISQRVQPKITYRAFKGADGNLKVHVYELDKRIKDLTLDEFQREYNSVKIKDNESKKLKIWEVLNENKKNARFSPKKEANPPVVKKDAEGDVQSKSINKNKRQSDLKGVLLETMMLTNILKEQLQVLKNKGINGTYQSSPYGKRIGLMNSQSQQGNNLI